MKKFILFVLILFCYFSSFAQYQTQLDIALRYLEENHEEYQLTVADIQNLKVQDINVSKKSGVTNIYFKQQHRGIEAYNGIVNVHITPGGNVLHAASNAMENFAAQLNAIQAHKNASQALKIAFDQQNLKGFQSLNVKKRSTNKAIYSNDDILINEAHATLVGFEHDGEIRLAWQTQVHHKQDGELWQTIVDAQTGTVLKTESLTLHCSFDHAHIQACSDHATANLAKDAVDLQAVLKTEAALSTDGSSYKVFAVPAESPAHGPHVQVDEPANPEASPFGWHDTNGSEGAEHFTLKGNNVEVVLDRDGNFVPDNAGPNGGANLQFLADFVDGGDIYDNEAASMTNLFYMCNVMHDFTVFYGFDESFNFQDRNYDNNNSIDNDFVIAYSQYGAEDNSGEFRNNANFATPSDGGNGVMRMYIWNRAAANLPLVNIVAPQNAIAGYSASQATFGGDLDDGPIEADVVLVDDGSSSPTLGCDPPQNDVNGKIAMIDRGVCEFGTKMLNAEQQGAIAVIVCNYQDGLVSMAPGRDGGSVTIPGVFLSKSDCDQIKLSLDNGLRIKLEVPDEGGPENLIGDFENGIIAHEYGHGISNRFTGGPSANGCLGGQEQMGEGWSDFMTLIISTNSNNNGAERRGIGTYVTREDNSGQGIRTYPYSNDMNVNPHTYDNIITESVPHGVGSVWNAMCWDLYWALVDQYGFDDDLYYGTGGNNIAIQLVFEGMKLQVCNPGFVDGRDAILAADEALYDGANRCLIWEVFARRGLGVDADQGSNASRSDGLESYNTPNSCSGALFVEKTADKDLINAGEDVTITLKINNYTGIAQSNVILTDEIPNGASVDESSISINYSLDGNILTFELGDLGIDGEQEITYTMNTSDANEFTSAYSLHQDWENGIDGWNIDFDEESGFFWNYTNDVGGPQSPYSGEFYWISFVTENTSIQSVFNESDSPIFVPEGKPVLRFFHKYYTEAALDGGLVQVSADGGTSWDALDLNFFRGAYRGTMQSPAFGAVDAFWGRNENFFGSYVDLSDYAGQNVLLRFRLGSNTGNETTQDLLYWILDDVDVFDMVNYNGEACVSSDQGASFCTRMEGRGVIVEPEEIVNVEEEAQETFKVTMSPNPTQGVLNVDAYTDRSIDIQVRVINTNGSVLINQNNRLNMGMQRISLDISRVPAGTYFVELRYEDEILVEKVLKN